MSIVPFVISMGEHYQPTPIVDVYEQLYEQNHYDKAPAEGPYYIPQIIHQIWLGSDVPPEYAAFIQSWQELHPDWEYRLWRDEDAIDYPFFHPALREAFLREPNWAVKSDIWRQDILYRFGGIYVDLDFVALKPLDAVAKTATFFVGLVRGSFVNNAIIGASPHHPFVLHCLEHLLKISGIHTNPAIVSETTGPLFLSRLLESYIPSHPDVASKMILYPRSYFYSIPHNVGKKILDGSTDQTIESFLHEETLAVHLWAKRWIKRPLREVIKRDRPPILANRNATTQ